MKTTQTVTDRVARFQYASGWKITIKADGLGPRLFLEYQEIYFNETKTRFDYILRYHSEFDYPYFSIRPVGFNTDDCRALVDFINNNS